MNGRILLVDDDKLFTGQLSALLISEGYQVTCEHDSSRVHARLAAGIYELVFLDIQMPPPDGLALLKEILKGVSHPEIVMLSGAASLQEAADSVKLGASDFLEKPPDLNRLLTVARNSCEKYGLKQENWHLKQKMLARYEIIGQSQSVLELKTTLHQIAETDSRILIWGETGVGKELVAGQIHYLSKRCSGPLIIINCASIPHDLAEAELFGYRKGAFTGALNDKPGKFEIADGGTLVLDEIAELPLALQSKLLRVLETGELEILGAGASKKVDVRLISISGRNLQELAHEGKFRPDLFYRLSTIPVFVPPLRDRKDDIPLLFAHFFDHLKVQTGQYERTFDPALVADLLKHDWPGNIRELGNYVERVFFLSSDNHISASLAQSILSQGGLSQDPPEESAEDGGLLKRSLDGFEKSFLQMSLNQAEGNVAELARRLGLDRGNLYKKLKRYNLV